MTGRFNDERRLHPRIETNLPVRIIANGYDFITLTQNVSCLGAYCRVDKYIPPFTRIAIKMDLPLKIKNTKEGDSNVDCEGVVVRTDDGAKGGFNLAIFFNRIKNNQKEKISRYLRQFLPQTSNV